MTFALSHCLAERALLHQTPPARNNRHTDEDLKKSDDNYGNDDVDDEFGGRFERPQKMSKEDSGVGGGT